MPILFKRDLALIQHPVILHESKDQAEITELVHDRKCWKGFTSQIEKAAEVSQTKILDAEWQYIKWVIFIGS